MSSLSSLKSVTDQLSSSAQKMPVLFVGHGSPMNGIENNPFSNYWKQLAKDIPTPQAVLCISAHWLTKGTAVTAMEQPKTIHDFMGFPKALFEVQYPAPGSPKIVQATKELIKTTEVALDHDWGLDHGTWTIVRHMYPEANIPILQLSIDYHQPASYHYELAKELADLRKKGVLIIGSGNMVHNLRMVEFSKINDDFGFDWALEMNETFKKHILSKAHKPLLNYETLGAGAKYAIPTPDHYFPLIYALGLQEQQDDIEIFNDKAVGGSLTMTSVRWG